MSKQLKISAIIPIAIVLIAIIAMMGLTTADSSKYPYGGNMPPWVDPHSAINKIPTVITNSTLWSSSPMKSPYDGNMPPWIEYNIMVPSNPVVLTINGNVNNPLSMTMNDLRSLGVTHVNLTLVSHGNTSYIDADSISLNALIQKASPKSGATNVVFTGSDGYSATVTLANVTADHGSVIACTKTQGLRNCLPTQAAKYWVQNLTSITVK